MALPFEQEMKLTRIFDLLMARHLFLSKPKHELTSLKTNRLSDYLKWIGLNSTYHDLQTLVNDVVLLKKDINIQQKLASDSYDLFHTLCGIKNARHEGCIEGLKLLLTAFSTTELEKALMHNGPRNMLEDACLFGQLEVMKLLLTIQPQILTNNEHRDPLFWACYHGHFKVVQVQGIPTDNIRLKDREEAFENVKIAYQR